MKPFVVNGETWQVVRVKPGDLRLVDRTGTLRIATTDPIARTIHISNDVFSPLLDKVLLHEVTHAITISRNLLDDLHAVLPKDLWILVEEWSVQLVEDHAIEASVLASEVLGRPICVFGTCIGYNNP